MAGVRRRRSSSSRPGRRKDGAPSTPEPQQAAPATDGARDAISRDSSHKGQNQSNSVSSAVPMSWLGTFLGAKSGDSVAPLVAAHVNLLVYAAAFWMAFPLIPFLARELGADDVELGYLTTFYSTLQLVGGPVVGRIGDRFGPRSALILTQLGSVVSYAFLAVAASLPGLFASRFWGVIQHAMQAAQALVALHSSHKDRAAALGRLSLSYGMGMVIGGPIGGKLASLEAVGSTGVALLSSALCAATIPLTLTFIRNDSSYAAPEVPAGDGEADAHQARSTRETTTVGLGLSRLVNVLRVPGVAPLILFNVILGFGVSVFRSSISHFAAEPFNLQPKDMGMLHAFAGLINIFSNTILVPMLLLYIGEPVLLYISTAVVMASLACFSGVGSYG